MGDTTDEAEQSRDVFDSYCIYATAIKFRDNATPQTQMFHDDVLPPS